MRARAPSSSSHPSSRGAAARPGAGGRQAADHAAGARGARFARVLARCASAGFLDDVAPSGAQVCRATDEALVCAGTGLVDAPGTRRVERVPSPAGAAAPFTLMVYVGTRLHVACARGWAGRASTLLSRGACTGGRDTNGATPLLTSCRVLRDALVPAEDGFACVHVLLSYGAALVEAYPPRSLNAGDTALHIAAAVPADGGGADLLALLLSTRRRGGGGGGASTGSTTSAPRPPVNSVNGKGHTPLHILLDGYGRGGCEEGTAVATRAALALLLQHGADVNVACEEPLAATLPVGALPSGPASAGGRVQPFVTSSGGRGVRLQGRKVRMITKRPLDFLTDRLLGETSHGEWPFTGRARGGRVTTAWHAVARDLLSAGARGEREETAVWCRKAGIG